MGTPMLTYSLSFPNSDPTAAVRSDRIVYLVTAIACSAKVPIELVIISYIRANNAAVNFVQPRHNMTGMVPNCNSLTPPKSSLLRGLQLVATPNMLVDIYYNAPAKATQADAVFQPYASAISGSAAASPPPTAGAPTDSGSAPTSATSISGGAIVGIIGGVAMAAAIIGVGYTFYINRNRKPTRRSAVITKSPEVQTRPKWTSSPLAIR
jgi:hypothetical protein